MPILARQGAGNTRLHRHAQSRPWGSWSGLQHTLGIGPPSHRSGSPNELHPDRLSLAQATRRSSCSRLPVPNPAPVAQGSVSLRKLRARSTALIAVEHGTSTSPFNRCAGAIPSADSPMCTDNELLTPAMCQRTGMSIGHWLGSAACCQQTNPTGVLKLWRATRCGSRAACR